MSRNVVFQVAIGKNDFAHYSLHTWKMWAAHNDYLHYVVSSSDYYPKHAKLQALSILDRERVAYDRVVVADYDTMIDPNTPDFLGKNGDPLGVVLDLGDVSWIQRACNKCMQVLGPPKLEFATYFNSGILVCDEKHSSLFHRTLEMVKGDEGLIPYDAEQTRLNWMVQHTHTPHQYLSQRLNQSKPSKNQISLDKPFLGVLHFNEEGREKMMSRYFKTLALH